jgi:hypothetical protein
MTLASVKEGDIVRCDGGSYGVVVQKGSGKLQVQWLGREQMRWVSARDVEAHYARRKS